MTWRPARNRNAERKPYKSTMYKVPAELQASRPDTFAGVSEFRFLFAWKSATLLSDGKTF